MHKYIVIFAILCNTLIAQETIKTHFQTARSWSPEIDICTDAAIIYGMNTSFTERANSWKDAGYNIQFMTSASWGQYTDFFSGEFDGKMHDEIAQTNKDGKIKMHGRTSFYIVPDSAYTEYMKRTVEKAIDYGVSAIYLEEPEYFNYTGYSKPFKQMWTKTYSTAWQPQETSPDILYKTAKLKSDIYFNLLKTLAKHIKTYSDNKVKCYIPTHSILNYGLWDIISPQNRLNTIDEIDGYIGQVWTGTARTPIFYDNIYKERTFENAYLEYATLSAMAGAGKKDIYFLTDPIEDAAGHTWTDYRENYQKTFCAQLMFPEVNRFEVMPWPNRIYFDKYANENGAKTQISTSYATEIAILVNVLNNISKTNNFNNKDIGVLLSHTIMFQNNYMDSTYIDPRRANFYGMALPLLKHGIPINIVLLEDFKESIGNNKMLLMTYKNMKPLSKEYHTHISEWVKAGGILLFFGVNQDPFNNIDEWWVRDGYTYPAQHLFELLNLDISDTNIQHFGEGHIKIINQNASDYVLDESNDTFLRNSVKEASKLKKLDWVEKNYMLAERNGYIIASVMDESINNEPLKLSGKYINMFCDSLPVINSISLNPGEVALLYDLNKIKNRNVHVLASSARFYNEKTEENKYTANIRGQIKASGISRIYSELGPTYIMVDNKPIAFNWNRNSSTLLIKFENIAKEQKLEISFK